MRTITRDRPQTSIANPLKGFSAFQHSVMSMFGKHHVLARRLVEIACRDINEIGIFSGIQIGKERLISARRAMEGAIECLARTVGDDRPLAVLRDNCSQLRQSRKTIRTIGGTRRITDALTDLLDAQGYFDRCFRDEVSPFNNGKNKLYDAARALGIEKPEKIGM